MGLSDSGGLTCPSVDELAPVVVGVDVGQRSDPSAIVVVEEHWDEEERLERYVGRYAMRVPIGTKYDSVAEIVKSIYHQQRRRDVERFGGWARFLRETIREAEESRQPVNILASELAAFERWPRQVTVRIDVTGVGRPLYDMVAPDLRDDGCNVKAVTLTGSDRLAPLRGDELSVGKEYMVARLQGMVESGRIRFPVAHSEFDELGAELKRFEIRRRESGSVESGAFGQDHDDLVIAAALAVLTRPFRPGIIMDMPGGPSAGDYLPLPNRGHGSWRRR